MAYQRKDQTEEEQNGGGLLGGYMQAAGGKLDSTAPQIPAPPMGNSGPSVTGFVNFDRIYNANEATAKRDAGKMSTQAQTAAQKAQGGLAGLQGQFSSQSKAAEGAAPSANDFARAKGGGTPFAVAPPTNAAVAGKFGPRTPNATFAPDTAENWESKMEARANAQYGGPASLGEMSGYKSVLADYGKADESLDALGSNAALEAAIAKQNQGPYIEGGNRLDAALTGAAGRPEFARVREQYKGLGDELTSATKASGEQAAQSYAAFNANKQATRGILDDYARSQEPKPEVDNAIRIGAASDTLGVTPETKAAWGSLDAGTAVAQHGANKSFNEITSGSDRTLDGVLHGTYGVSQEDAAWVRGNMTPNEWAEYQQAAATSPEAVLAWIRKVLGRKK
jgi:hypothetical protein